MHLFSSKGICILSDKALWRSMKDQQRGHKGQWWTMGLFFIKRSLCFVVAFLRHSLERVHLFCSVRHEIKLREDSVPLGQNVLARTATGTKKDTLLFPPSTSSALNTKSSSNKMCTSSPRSYLKAEVDLLDPRRSGLVNAPSMRPKTIGHAVCLSQEPHLDTGV